MFDDLSKLENYQQFKLSNGMILYELMQEKNIGYDQIFPILGPKTVINEIINGKRLLKQGQIKLLSELFQINEEIFDRNEQKSEIINSDQALDQNINEYNSSLNHSESADENVELNQFHDYNENRDENTFDHSEQNNQMKPFWED